MKWLLMWLNVSVATLNATLQLLVIYRFAITNVVFSTIIIEKTRFRNKIEDDF